MPGALHKLDPRHTAAAAPPRDAASLEKAGREALRAGDHAAAVEYLQLAAELSPLNRGLRALLADALLAYAHARRSRTSEDRMRASAILAIDEDEPAPTRRTSRTAPKPARVAAAPPPKPERVEKRTAKSASRPAARHEDFDDEDRYIRTELTDEPAPRAARPRGRRNRGRMAISAVMYAGVLLLVAGVVHGVVTRFVTTPDLPTVSAPPALPDGLSALLGQASAKLGAGEPDAALSTLENAATAWPGYESAVRSATVQALRAKGARHLASRDYPKAVAAYQKAAELEPQGSDNWIELGRALREHGRARQAAAPTEGRTLLTKAADAYERALESDPDSPAALVGIAQTYAFLNERKGAVSYYEQVIDRAPTSPEAEIARQNLRQLTGRG